MANFFDQFDAPPPSGVGQDRPIPTMGKPTDENYFSKFDAPLSGVDPVDIAKSGASGLTEGAFGIAGLPGDVNQMAMKAGHAVAEFFAGRKLPMPPGLDQMVINAIRGHPVMETGGPKIFPTSQDLMDRTGVSDMLHKPTTALGGYAETAASMVPGGVAFGGTRDLASGVENAIRYGVIPGITSEAAGQATQGTPIEPVARFLGAAAGATLPARIATPFPMSPERQAAVDTLRGEGVTDLTAGQVTGNKALKYLESETGGGRLADIHANQGEQFTRATLARAGEPAARATPEVVNHAFERIGGEFDRLAQHNTMGVDAQLSRDLFDVAYDYRHLVGENTQAPIVNRLLNDIYDKMQAGPTISGEEYQALRSQVDRFSRATNDPMLGHALFGIRTALDDAMQRTMSPQDQAAWRTARTEYRNLMVVQQAATGAGEDAALGIISPAKLRQAAVGQDQRGYVRGRNDFSDLAHAGQAVMTPLPQSGTAARVASRVVPAAVGNLVGSILTGDPTLGGTAGVLAGLGAPAAVGRTVLSGPGRAYLGNQLIPRSGASNTEWILQQLMYGTEPSRKAGEVKARRTLENMATRGP